MQVPGRPSERSQAAEWRYWQDHRLDHWSQEWRRYLRYFPFDAIDFERESLLDVGSGPVSILEFVSPRGAQVVAVDALADQYNELMPDKRIAIQKELPDRRFDRVLLLNALDHMDAPTELLDTLAIRLKPQGELWLHVHIERPYPSEEHPQRFAYWQLNRMVSKVFDLVRVRIYRDGPVWPYAWCGICWPRRRNTRQRALSIVTADVTCSIARAWVFAFRAGVKGTKMAGLRSLLPVHLRQ